ncbi:hypothetical protein SBC2_09640 [Caballeronia sp. SBC2]|nr:hypothetical protein SBC2_09640 [Caballeronia sp. SBC2]
MKGLVFNEGGKLEYVEWVRAEADEEDAHVGHDVTGNAAAYILEPVIFAGEIYVRDIFSLLDRNPVLLKIFQRAYAAEYLQEAKKGDALAYTGEYDPEGIEYLELFYDWEEESDAGVLTGVHRLWLHGVGYELRDDTELEGQGLQTKGTRIHWAIKFSPLAHLFNLPLRFNSEVSVADSRRITIHTFRVPSPTLAQVIGSVLWELSWAGNPQATDELVEMIRDISDDVNMSGSMSAKAFIERLKKLNEE